MNVDRRASPDHVEVDFGAGPRWLHPWTVVLGLRPATGLVRADGAVDWAPLAALPELRAVEWSGPDRGIVDAVAARPGIRFLYWTDAAGDLELRRTHLGTVRLEGAELRDVQLPRLIETVLLRRPPADSTSKRPTTAARWTCGYSSTGPTSSSHTGCDVYPNYGSGSAVKSLPMS